MATSSKRKKGPLVVKKTSKEAKRIEATHGFEKSLKEQEKRDKGNAEGDSE